MKSRQSHARYADLRRPAPNNRPPIPQLRIEVDRDRALAYGVTPGDLNE